jgi:hypothetical protein
MRKTTLPATGTSPLTRLAAKPSKNKAAVALGKLGGRKGGLTRAKNLTAAERTAIAKKAAKARWKSARTKRKP